MLLLCIGEKSFVDDKNRLSDIADPALFKSQDDEFRNFILSIFPKHLENNYNFPFRFSFKPKKSKTNSCPPFLAIAKQFVLKVMNLHLNLAQNGLENRFENFVSKNADNI